VPRVAENASAAKRLEVENLGYCKNKVIRRHMFRHPEKIVKCCIGKAPSCYVQQGIAGNATSVRYSLGVRVVNLVQGSHAGRTAALVVCAAVVAGSCSDAADFGRHRKSRETDTYQSRDAAATVPADAGGADTTASMPVTSASVDEVGELYEEQRCPDAVQRIERVECDPLAETDPDRVSDCPEFEGCYPYVQYPSAPCEPETFGTRCSLAGTGLQGQACSATRCAPGFLCVVTGRGMQCAELCRLPGVNTCADGFICGSLDIDGFGVCI
jgi:hypothetical protein